MDWTLNLKVKRKAVEKLPLFMKCQSHETSKFKKLSKILFMSFVHRKRISRNIILSKKKESRFWSITRCHLSTSIPPPLPTGFKQQYPVLWKCNKVIWRYGSFFSIFHFFFPNMSLMLILHFGNDALGYSILLMCNASWWRSSINSLRSSYFWKQSWLDLLLGLINW